MYQVNLGAKVLYYPTSEDAVIYDTELNEEVGLAGEFTFKVPPQNPLYSELTQGALVTILKDDVEVWRGEIRNIDTDFAKIASVYCLEDLAWLADEYLTPALITNETFAQRFQTAIGAYNANRSTERRFAVGYITNVNSSNNCNWQTEYEESILECLRKCICQAGTTTGYVRVRRVTSGGVVTRYIDIVRLADYGSQTTQPIEYGYNLLDYVKESDYSNLVNVLTPYGDDLDSEIYEGYSAKLQGTTITNTSSVNVYGRHAKAVVFDGVTDVNILNTLAAAYLTRYSQPQLTMEVEAVDLSAVESVDEITIGDSVRIIAQPFAVDQWLYLTQIKRDIQNIDKNSITLSGYVRTGRTITSQARQTTEAVKNIPSKASILDAARKNALEILNGVDGGYVTFETNANDQITELRIANLIDYTQATKCWRWNLGGLAYLERETAADNWTVTTAATMDGGFVADFITAGTIRGITISGNTISGNTISGGTITGASISGNTISGNTISGGTITGASISGNTISGGTITGASISGNTISGGTITGTAISGGTITGASIESPSPSGRTGSVSINGGSLRVHDGSSGFFRLTSVAHPDCNLALGGYQFAAYNDSVYYGDYESIYIGKAAEEAGAGSDRRLKKNVKTIDRNTARKLITSIRPVSFEYNAKSGMHNEHGTRFGLIAQEVREVLDACDIGDCELEYERWDNYHTIEYKELIAHLIACIQDLYEQINSLKGEKNG